MRYPYRLCGLVTVGIGSELLPPGWGKGTNPPVALTTRQNGQRKDATPTRNGERGGQFKTQKNGQSVIDGLLVTPEPYWQMGQVGKEHDWGGGKIHERRICVRNIDERKERVFHVAR